MSGALAVVVGANRRQRRHPRQVAAATGTAVRARRTRPAEALAHQESPPLVVVSDVEILEVGENWHLSTGDTTFTPEDLASAVAALEDPAVRAPILKLGHRDRRPGFDGQPAFGKLINLRTTNDGMTLVADVAGVPRWLADIWPTAFPSRSIEGYFDLTTATGRTHRFALSALALLGEVEPAIETLADLPLAFGVPIEDEALAALDPTTPAYGLVSAETRPQVPGARRFEGQLAEARAGTAVAQTSYEDVRRAYYEQLDDRDAYWFWIRELVIDPQELIVVDDSEDRLYRVSYAIADGEVTFGEPVEVRVEYVDVAAARRREGVHLFASRAASREGVAMDLTALRRSLGVPDTMPDEEVLSTATQRLAGGQPPAGDGTAGGAGTGGTAGDASTPPPAPAPPAAPAAPTPTATGQEPPGAPSGAPAAPTGTGTVTQPTGTAGVPGDGTQAPPPAPAPTAPQTGQEGQQAAPAAPQPVPSLAALAAVLPPGAVIVDGATWQQTEANARAGAEALARQRTEDRQRFIDGVVRAGRVAPGNGELIGFLERTWDRNRQEAEQIAGALQPAFATFELGHGAAEELTADVFDRSDVALFPELAVVRASNNGRS